MDNIENVLKKKCVGCGTCIGVCKQNALSKKYSKKLGYYNIIIDKTKCNGCGACKHFCPTFSREDSAMLGDYLTISLMYAKNEKIRKNATSGGVVFTVVREALRSGLIDKAYMLGWSQTDCMQTKLYELDNEALLKVDNNRLYSSRYISYPIGEVLKKINSEKKYIIVGTPCQIAGIRNVKKNNVFLIGIACSGATSYIASELSQKHLNKEFDANNDQYYYRGNGWSGFNETISNLRTNSEQHLESYFNVLFSTKIFTRKGCRFCNDQLGEKADISCFDFWNKDELSKDNIGKTGVIVRNELGEKLLENAKEQLVFASNIAEEDVIASQRIPLLYKKQLYNKKPLLIKVYFCIVGIILKTKIYRLFSINTYMRFARLYNRFVSKYAS